MSPDDPIRLWLAHRTWLQTAVQRDLPLIPLVPSSVGRVERQETRPGLQGFCHGAVPFLICSMSREATFLTKASLFISLTQSRLRSHERL